jgi:hypothetical protein
MTAPHPLPAVVDEESGYGGSPAPHTVTAVALLGVPPVRLASATYPAVRMTAATFSLVYQVRHGTATMPCTIVSVYSGVSSS